MIFPTRSVPLLLRRVSPAIPANPVTTQEELMLQILFRQYLEAPQTGCVFYDPLADSDADNDSE